MPQKKAFKSSASPARELESTPKARQYPVGVDKNSTRSSAKKAELESVSSRGLKKIISYKISESLGDQITRKAEELRHSVRRKVWPAHVAEAAFQAFLEMDESEQVKWLNQLKDNEGR